MKPPLPQEAKWRQILIFAAPAVGLFLAFELGYRSGHEYALDEYVDSGSHLVHSGPALTLQEFLDYFRQMQWLLLSLLFWLIVGFSWLIHHLGRSTLLSKLTMIMAMVALGSVSLQLLGASIDFWTGDFSMDSLLAKIVAFASPTFYFSSLGFALGFLLCGPRAHE